MAKRRTTKRRRATTDAEQSAAAPVVETGNTEPPAEDSYAVFHWPGPGSYRGRLAGGRGIIPRHQELSLAPATFKEALANGLRFVRWAGLRGPSLEL